ncbi:hypothetical protein PFISCL1PPCAC_1037, partial [Pristionchus fissidentatus]
KEQAKSTQPTAANGLRLPNKQEVAMGSLAIGVAAYQEGGIGCGTVQTTAKLTGGWFGMIGGEMLGEWAGEAVGSVFPQAKPFVQVA